MIKQITLKNIKELSKLNIKVLRNNTRRVFDESVMEAIKESEQDIKNGRVYDGKKVLKELRKKYGYK